MSKLVISVFIVFILFGCNNDEPEVSPAEQLAIDIDIIDNYLSENNIVTKSTPEGLRYEILVEGTGEIPNARDLIQVHYTGKLLSGEIFDSSVERGTPFEFELGMGNVIAGWDIGFQLLPVGTKAKLYIPSPLAYGSRQMSDLIKANSIMVFEVEVLAIIN